MEIRRGSVRRKEGGEVDGRGREGGRKRKKQSCTNWDLCMYDNSLLSREQRARYTRTNREVCEPSIMHVNLILIDRVSSVGPTRASQGLSEASLKAYEDMNHFLSAFIERVGIMLITSSPGSPAHEH